MSADTQRNAAYVRPFWIKVEMLRERLAIWLAPWAVYEDVRDAHK